jgi:N-acetylglucosamine repressor
MRRIDPVRFRVATQGTSRDINRRIALNLVRAQQPISRADLARAMGVRRGTVSVIVNELLDRQLVFEGATGEAVRGRKPTFLYIETRRRCVVAIDIRASQTFLRLFDLVGKPLSEVVRLSTAADPATLVADLSGRVASLLAGQTGIEACEGIGVVVPGMVDQATRRVLHAPTLGWRDVELGGPLALATGLPVHIENSGRACALAQLWMLRDETSAPGDLVYVSVSDGLGVGVIVHGEPLRGHNDIAGEFGHVPLALDGPRCACGATGCWEAYVSNRATLARYFGRSVESGPVPEDQTAFTIDDLIARARTGDAKAAAAIQATARYLGAGLAGVINVLNPSRLYVGGEITTAWELLEPTVRQAIAERALTAGAAATPIRPVNASEYPRLQGAAALVAAPAFAAPVVA